MRVLFYNGDGSPEMVRTFARSTGWTREQSEVLMYPGEFKHAEGDEVEYHVGHGVLSTYRVEAVDESMALLRYLRHRKQ